MDWLAVKQYLALIDVQQAKDRFQHGGFARPVRADDHTDLIGFQRHVHPVKDIHAAIAAVHIPCVD
ncbi:hypothetical protein HORIV_02220 [Vreelandella olivaria]|uniref:Uncharacterized protein n=1 Tax=Vreelandella olivaria TaxID=390919 RepID=A0ABN5WL98_9GAMM|nr:hypothetical protein HORIV_02220 [Halomonas olivaria]